MRTIWTLPHALKHCTRVNANNFIISRTLCVSNRMYMNGRRWAVWVGGSTYCAWINDQVTVNRRVQSTRYSVCRDSARQTAMRYYYGVCQHTHNDWQTLHSRMDIITVDSEWILCSPDKCQVSVRIYALSDISRNNELPPLSGCPLSHSLNQCIVHSAYRGCGRPFRTGRRYASVVSACHRILMQYLCAAGSAKWMATLCPS